jgi:hypothetical protein
MFFWEGNWGRETDDLNELVLEDGEIRVAFLKGVRTEGETNRDVIAGMRLWLGCLNTY